MSISVTSTHHALMVAWARHDIETLTGPNPSRERAERVLEEWHSYGALTGAEIADVLAAYLSEEPEPVADPDPWCEIVADSAAVVDAMLAEDLRIKPKVRHRSLSEMVDAANAEAEKFNAEFPPGTPVEYWRGFRQGDGAIGHTKGVAFASNSGTAVVFIDNTSGYIALSHVRPLVEVTDEPTAGA